nr:hypothetical protein [Candidatus Moranbacteria bacterium]
TEPFLIDAAGNVVVGSATAASGTKFTLQTNPWTETGDYSNFLNVSIYNGSTTNTGTIINSYNDLAIDGSGNKNNALAGYDWLEHHSTGTLSLGIATSSYFYTVGGTVTEGVGVRARVNNAGTTTTITDAYAVDAATDNTSTGTIASAYGVRVNVTNTGGGTVTTGYGIYLGDIAGTTDYGVYQTGSNDVNYFAGNTGFGDTSPAALLTVGSGDLFQVNSSGVIAAAAGITSSGTITFSGFTSNGGPLYTNGSGVLAQVTAGTSTQILHGGTTPSFGSVVAADVTADTFDFTEFEDTLDLDAALTLNQTTNTWSQTFTGTTTTGYTYAANSLTSGSAYTIGSSAASAFTGSLVNINLSDGTGASSNTGSLLSLTNSGTANANTSFYLRHYATGTNNLAFRIDDVSGDTTPFVVDGTGAVGIGTTAPASMFETYGTGSADLVATLTAPDATYDPIVKFRTGSTPAVQFSLGVDNSDSDKFKIYSGDGLGSGDEFVIDANGVTTIANLNLGATSFDEDAGIVSWTDLQVSTTPAAATVESYSAQIDGSNFLTIYAEADGSGGLTSTASAVKADVQLDATADGLVTKVNAGACSDSTFNRDTNGTLCVDSTNGRIYYRYGGAWHYTAQTAGFQIPSYETAPQSKLTDAAEEEQANALPFDSSSYPEYLTKRLEPGEFLIPYVDEYLDDGAVHGLYARFDDVKSKLFGEEQTQIAQLTLQTNQNVSSLAELQVSVDDQLIVVGNSLNGLAEKDTAIDAKLAEYETYFASDQSRLSTLETVSAQLSLDANVQASKTAALETEVETLTEQVNTLTDFYATFNLGTLVARDTEGNVDLLEGKLKAKILETGALTIEVVDPEAPTIGTASILPILFDEDHDGKDDETGSDGKSIDVMTKAMIPMVKGSRIFTSFKNNPGAFSWVEKIRNGDGEYVGFKIRLSDEVTEETKLDWWLVEQKDSIPTP